VSLVVRILLVGLGLAAGAVAEDHWVRIKSGPFEVITPAGDRAARQRMFEAEQFRYALGELLGSQELATVWPIKLVVLKNPQPLLPAMSRDSWIAAVNAGEPLTPEWRRACARILIDDNIGRIPQGIESGLITLISTLEVKSVKLTLGTPPPAAERTREWARVHLFATQPEYPRGLRMLLSNLAHGADYDAACRNAFQKPAVEMEKRVDAYLAAGKFEAIPFSGRALSEKDFTVREVESYDGRLALADLLLADPTKAAQAEAAYKALTGPEPQEGLALLASQRKEATALKLFETATTSGSKNARAWLGTGTKAGAIKAIELNPKWPDPHVRLAELGAAPNVKAAELGKAAALAPRNAELWKQAALAYVASNQYVEAGKAWSGAERAALNDEERGKLRQARIDNERLRADYEAGERRRIATEEAKELERLKNASLAEVRAAETKARNEMAGGGPVPTKPQEWWDGPNGPSQKAAGKLLRVDCLTGGRSKLTVQTGPKAVVVMIRDPGKIVIAGGGERSLACGPQRPAREVTIEYTPNRDAKLGTAGDVQVIEFK
jgi:hypothetical protein